MGLIVCRLFQCVIWKNTVEVERRCAEENGPVFVTKNGYGRLVVMDIEYYVKNDEKDV